MVHSRLQIAQAPRSAPSARLSQLTRDLRHRPLVVSNRTIYDWPANLLGDLAALRATTQPRLIDEVLTIRMAHA